MNGTDRQKQKAARLKEEIKRNTARQREQVRTKDRTLASSVENACEVISDMVVSSMTSPISLGSNIRKAHSDGAMTITDKPTLVSSLPWGHERSSTLDQASASEMNLITKYLDFFFPALFPHYKPHVFDCGRTWLLVLLKRNSIAHHAILGLSCYLFTMALSDAGMDPTLESCKAARWEEVDREAQRCFEELRTQLVAQNLRGTVVPVTTLEKVELMAGITQVIVFETSMGQSAHWNTHLSPALVLFEEVMSDPAARSIYRGLRQSKFASVLLGIGDPLWTNPGICNHIWSPDQSGFRFCAGFLVLMDVLASTALGQEPRLLRYHGQVLAEQDDGLPTVGEAEIRLSGIYGCSNWVIGLIAEISVLNYQKVRQVESDISINEEWFERSSNIENRLQDKINAIELGSIEQLWDHRLEARGHAGIRLSTMIWAYAAQLYLRTVRDGWCSLAPSVRDAVTKIITLIPKVASADTRAIVWPICVAGCLALESERQVFIDVIERLSKIQRAGALDDARLILLEVWRMSITVNTSTWTVASCLGALGSPLPLV